MDQSDVFANPLSVEYLQRSIVDVDLSAPGLVKADDKITERTLSRAASSDDEGDLAGRKEEVRLFEDFGRGIRGVRKAYLSRSVPVFVESRRTYIFQFDIATAELWSQSSRHWLDRTTIPHVTSDA